jgi:hypothetical protein
MERRPHDQPDRCNDCFRCVHLNSFFYMCFEKPCANDH